MEDVWEGGKRERVEAVGRGEKMGNRPCRLCIV